MLQIVNVRSLLCVAGPRASGKSTFVDTLVQPDEIVPATLPRALHTMKGWKARTHSRLRTETQPRFKNLIAHYDLLRGRKVSEESLIPDLLHRAEEASIVTLWADIPLLVERLRERQRNAVGPRNLARAQTLDGVVEMYQSPGQLVAIYEDWFAKVASIPVSNHWIVDTSDRGLKALSLSVWPDLRERMDRFTAGVAD